MKNTMINWSKIWILAVLLAGVSFQCKKKEVLTIGGSETIGPTAEYLGRAFEKENDAIQVEVIGGGSQVGLDLLGKGKLDMALSSRDLSEEEFAKLNQHSDLEKLTIAYDGIAIVVHPDNPVSRITATQLSDVFSGKVTNWSKLGGKDIKIETIVRNDNSGTLKFFTTYALRQKLLGSAEYEKNKSREFSENAKSVKDNEEMADIIRKSPNAIGFMGMGSAMVESEGKVKSLLFAKSEKDEFVAPTPKTVLDRKYKFSRGLYLIYRADTKAKIESFTSFLTGNKGQELIMKRGFLRASLPEVEVKADQK